MPSLLQEFRSNKSVKRLTDTRNIGLYIFAVIVLAITWSGVKTVQTNYELQKKVSTLRQQNEVLELQNGNTKLKNQYLKTDQYLELAARQQLGLAAPGETVLLIPEATAKKYVDSKLASATTTNSNVDDRSGIMKNLTAWRDFLLGRNLTTN